MPAIRVAARWLSEASRREVRRWVLFPSRAYGCSARNNLARDDVV